MSNDLPVYDMSDKHHSITVTITTGYVEGEFNCSAPMGADCHLGCAEQCAAWLNGDSCDHPRTQDEGFCLPITWLNSDDAYWYELYNGDSEEVRSGPIQTKWDGAGYVWTYAD